ncbi:MAG: DUF2461 domain-containing protein [Nevskia sp.]|nr:DUF2461 domain-containing protein [Nevskia sp.]
MAQQGTVYFTPASFKFLRGLARNNSREWFAAHKQDYEGQLRQPFLRLIADLAEPLRKLNPHYVANPKPVGGSLFRIYRDTRFSGDKTPYKPWAGATFYHEATRALVRGADGNSGMMGRLDAPVFYLHVQPGECFAGGGLWHPMPETVKRVRGYMTSNPASWKKATHGAAFAKVYGGLGGDSLSRPPRGYDPEHELIEDLKRKDYVCSAPLDDAALCAPGLVKLLLQRYSAALPMIDWLCGALDLEF